MQMHNTMFFVILSLQPDSSDQSQSQVLCAAVAVILQYVILVAFMWMLMEGVVLYLALVVVFMSSNSKYMALFALLSYGESVACATINASLSTCMLMLFTIFFCDNLIYKV